MTGLLCQVLLGKLQLDGRCLGRGLANGQLAESEQRPPIFTDSKKKRKKIKVSLVLDLGGDLDSQ